jgi:hypothetical protein
LKEDALVQISKASPDVRDVLIKALQIWYRLLII